MSLMTLYVYSFDRLCRAVMLTCATTDTSFLVNCRDKEGILIFGIFHNQTDGSYWAVSCTSQTFNVVGIDDAEVRIDDGVTYLYG